MKSLNVQWSLAGIACIMFLGQSAQAANTTPPTISASNQVAECRQPTVSVWINPKLTSNWDPLPYATFTNRLATDPPSYPTNSDPDLYPFGSRKVDIRGCDHNTPTANCNDLIVTVTVRDSLPPSVYPGSNKIVQCKSYLGTPAYVSTTGTPYCTDTCNSTCPACLDPNQVYSSACTACFNTCMSSCTSNPNYVYLDKPQVSDICDIAPRWVSDAPPTYFPLGKTTLHVTGFDFTGNTAVKTILVQVQDNKAPTFSGSTPPFNVLSHAGSGDALDCSIPGGTTHGTLVVLPSLNGNDNCTQPSNLAYSWYVSNAANLTPQNPAVCIPDTGSSPATVQFVVTDASGNTDTSKGAPATTTQVSVNPNTFFPVAMNVSASTGFVKQGQLTAAVTGNSTPYRWTIVSAAQSDSPAGNSNNIHLIWSTEGKYCPTYVSVTDNANNGGAAPYTCFGVDATTPQHTFSSIPTPGQWPNNGTPIFAQGAAMPLQIVATDTAGRLQSGVKHVTATISTSQNTNIVVYDHDFSAQCTTAANALNTCLTTQTIGGCNQTGTNGVCMCTAVDSTGSCTTDGRLDLGKLGRGSYTMAITVSDFAGNSETQAYPFVVSDLGTAVSGNGNNNLVAMLAAVIANPNTPVAALSSLTAAKGYAGSAGLVYAESPGQAFLLAQQVWNSLDQALSNGANVAFYESFVANLVQGEVRKIYKVTDARVQNGNMTAWSILTDPNGLTRGVYKARRFLTQDRTTLFRDYTVDPVSTMKLSGNYVAIADHQMQVGQTSQALASSLSAFDTMSVVFMDSTFASPALYNRAVHTVTVGSTTVPEGYFRESDAGHYGAEVGATVNAQLMRFNALAQGGALYGVPPTVLTTINAASNNLQSFAAAVAFVQNANWNAANANGFSNQKLVQSVYLNAISALQQLQTIQGSSIYTRYWQTGVAFTLADVVNFSLYEGQTALTCILWGRDTDGIDSLFNGCSANAVPNAPKILDMQGAVANPNMDWEAQVAECRYSRMMYALGDGRLSGANGALSLFTSSACLIIDLYNRYYGAHQYLANDNTINPNAYGCPATPAVYTQADGLAACGACNLGAAGTQDTNCDGIDSDCNGVADDGYIPTSCGCGTTAAQNASSVCPCAATSACVAGQSLPCTPGFAPATSDTQCNGRDNNCNGTIGENYLPVSCGVGGCMQYSSCDTTTGTLHACVPKTASLEVCDGTDNNCNVLVDEFLDNDTDGYGCPPCNLYTTQTKCASNLGCTWTGSSCVGLVTCSQCDSSVQTCPTVGSPNSLLCRGDINNGAWTHTWDCADNDPTVYPNATEICDGKDNNCNGAIDENVKNACGNCDPSCTSTMLGAPGTPFTPTPNNSQNIAQDPNTGNVGLTSQQVNTQFAWVSNDTAGTVSKIDTVTGKEVGRYCQALKTGVTTFVRPGNTDPTGATYDTRAEPTVCAGCGGCNRGSRTAVDKAGNVYLANRAHSPTAYQGTYTKIAGNVSGCVDVNGDGTIQTSRDVNGDGVINPNINLPAAAREYWGELDECILWTRKPTTWVGTNQPSCNTPGWPANDSIGDPLDSNFIDEKATCLADPNSYYVSGATQYGVCQWTNACNGSGDATTCASYTTKALCDPNGVGYYPKINPTTFCTWSGNTCSPTACSTSNSNKGQCKARTGCSWFQDCYNTGETPYSTSVGPIIPRAVAIDAQGAVWLGLYNRLGMMRLDPTTGYVTRWVYDGQPPYGAAIDKNGILWHTQGCCGAAGLMSINTNPNTVTYINPDNGNVTWSWTGLGVNGPTGYWHSHPKNPGSGSYGIAIDGLNRVYLGSYPSQTEAGYRYDSARNTWTMIKSSTDPNGTRLLDAGIGRGLTVDASGNVWIAQHGDNGGRLTQFDSNTLLPKIDVELAPKGTIPIGVGIGYGGKIWTNNQGTSNVSVVDPQTGLVGYFPVGGQPYTYSDFTGSILRTFTAPQGTYSEIINACYGFQVNSWVNLIWNGITPVGTANQGRTSSPTTLKFRIRGANQLVTKDVNGNPVDPAVASNWSLWFPDDISDPNKNAADANRVYYYTMQPQAQWPTTGPCVGLQSVNGTYVTGCADLTAMPTTYTWTSSQPNQPIAYIQVQVVLVSDSDNTVQPTLINYQVSRTCPQF